MIRSEKLQAVLSAAFEKTDAMELLCAADAVVSFDEEALDAVAIGLTLGKAVAAHNRRVQGVVGTFEVFHAAVDGVHYLFVEETEDEAVARVQEFLAD